MTQRRYPDKSPIPLSSGGNSVSPAGAPILGNLAVQASIMEIFDEFTEVISGELKSMKLQDPAASEHPKPSEFKKD